MSVKFSRFHHRSVISFFQSLAHQATVSVSGGKPPHAERLSTTMADTKNTLVYKHRKLFILLAAALVVAGAVIAAIFLFGGKKEETQSLFKESPVARGDLTVGITESGTAALQSESVVYDFTAEVEQVSVKAGQRVQKGDVLATLSAESLQQELDKLELDYEKSTLQLSKALVDQKVQNISDKYTYESNQALADSAPLQYDATLDELYSAINDTQDTMAELDEQREEYEDALDSGVYEDNNVAALRILMNTAKNEYDRLKAQQAALVPGDSSLDGEVKAALDAYNKAKDDYDKAYASYVLDYDEIEDKLKQLDDQYDTAQLKYEQQQASLALNELQAQSKKDQDLSTAENAQQLYNIAVAQTNNEIATQKLNLKTLELQMEELKKSLENTSVTAPCAGIVMSVGYQAGDAINKNTALFTLSNSENVYVNVSIAQEDINSIEIGKEALVALDAFEGIPLDGVVDSITTSPARAASSTVSYTVTVKLSGDTAQIYEGMTGDVTFVSKQKKDVLYVSNRAVYIENEKQYVKIKDESGNPKAVEVTTGFSDGSNVEVLSGLNEGDVALIEGKVTLQ